MRVQVRGDAWRQMTLRTALMFPGVASVVFFTLNVLIWGQASSGAVSFSTLFALCFLWFGVSVPLVFTGSYFGFKRAPEEEPVRTNKIPRQVRRHGQTCERVAVAPSVQGFASVKCFTAPKRSIQACC